MLWRLIVAALSAGLAAGCVVLLAQMASVLPLIHLAEHLETGAPLAAYAPPEGLFAIALSDPERLLGTFAFDVLGGVAFALIVGAAMSYSPKPLNWRTGLVWGLAGWAAAALAPAISQPPLPPGVTFVDLEDRQLWWVATVVATIAGLALAAFSPLKAMKALGAVLLVAPHLVGAPGGADDLATIPGDLARDYALASLMSTFLFWMTLGAVAGHLLGAPRKVHN